MSKITITANPDGSANFADEGGFLAVVQAFRCDGCDKRFRFPVRWEALARGATGRVCAVLWFCTKCGPEMGSEHTDDCEHE